MKKVRFLLVASLFAVSFTFSCSGDNNNGGGGGWLTCQELYSVLDRCGSEYDTSDDACKHRDCDEIEEQLEQCITKAACNGTKGKECENHYKEQGCKI